MVAISRPARTMYESCWGIVTMLHVWMIAGMQANTKTKTCARTVQHACRQSVGVGHTFTSSLCLFQPNLCPTLSRHTGARCVTILCPTIPKQHPSKQCGYWDYCMKLFPTAQSECQDLCLAGVLVLVRNCQEKNIAVPACLCHLESRFLHGRFGT